jgi:hypothetical protein
VILVQRMRLMRSGRVLAVAALYALLLQGFLGGLLAVDPFTSAIHCAPGGGPGAPGKSGPAHDAACCLLACRTVLGSPPTAAAPAARLGARIAPHRPPSDPAAAPAAPTPPRARGPPLA